MRESSGLSQTLLAKEIDMYVRTISRWETGELPVPKVSELALRFIALWWKVRCWRISAGLSVKKSEPP